MWREIFCFFLLYKVQTYGAAAARRRKRQRPAVSIYANHSLSRSVYVCRVCVCHGKLLATFGMQTFYIGTFIIMTTGHCIRACVPADCSVVKRSHEMFFEKKKNDGAYFGL